MQQQTLAATVQLSGISLHKGASVAVRLCPAPAGSGRYFVRADLAGTPAIPALARGFRPSPLCTTLSENDAAIQTVEHVLAALYGLGIDNCRIEVDGPELPILDGSARPYVEAMVRSGTVLQNAPRRFYQIAEPVAVYERDAFVAAMPTDTPALQVSYGIDFAHPIGRHWFSLKLTSENFAREVAPARTFTLQSQVEQLLSCGLIQGGSLDCALVAGADDWLTPPTWPDEPARHKLLDLLGDLSLAGVALGGHIVAYKAGHALHGRLARALAEKVPVPSACSQKPSQ
ncbi:UDP-3-O-acyl-N-acetylglucosamine deacetylase [Gloeobacter morelensis]|uniref:UDP-3-O-acyl-N-acetylglucosamine deacetylase n=1 Tax=Gloeobacter morelensis MG652769 TaxID=2781736 RepID=A0ABY3PMQ3_9CYAN|nr:UDP-3-O-acyl-N-acetylglucosamine deacetylase [Gloeobacter morelensis]UFP94859.1 UDP-3-O-[3-hydroxymyristoyl] N-acetylglucosamine deacetylase [Gloeobacter morelensis MG652769]